jgi:hypothetical protein
MTMSDELLNRQARRGERSVRHSAEVPPVNIPPGHVGPVVLPGTGRLVWWTGRVAIGLRHQSGKRFDTFTQSGQWIQELMLGKPKLAAGA